MCVSRHPRSHNNYNNHNNYGTPLCIATVHRCAARLARRLNARDDLQGTPPSVLVLRGGFTTFVRHYRHEADLVDGIEGHDAEGGVRL